MTNRADRYRDRCGELFEDYYPRGYLTLPVLQFLKGCTWDDLALGFVRSLNPWSIRVTQDEITTDAVQGRVTIYVDDDNIIQEIEQDVTVCGGSGQEVLSEFKKRYGRTVFQTPLVQPDGIR